MATARSKSIEDYRTDAMLRGALDAREDIAPDALANRYVQRHLKGLHGGYRKNVEAVLIQGYNEGHKKAQEYYKTLQ